VADYFDQQVKADFKLLWLLLALVLLTLATYIFASHYFGAQIQNVIKEEQRIMIRSVLYALTIISFPFTNLIRFIMVRLNQTMPGKSTARHRYFITLLVSMIFAGSIGIYGFVMFMLGDSYNTLYIFCILSALAAYLYRPKYVEYLSIIEALIDDQE